MSDCKDCARYDKRIKELKEELAQIRYQLEGPGCGQAEAQYPAKGLKKKKSALLRHIARFAKRLLER